MRKDGTLTAGLSQARHFAYTCLSCVPWGKAEREPGIPISLLRCLKLLRREAQRKQGEKARSGHD